MELAATAPTRADGSFTKQASSPERGAMIGYVLWLLAGAVLGVWLAPWIQAMKASISRHLQRPDTVEDRPWTAPDDDPTRRDRRA